MFRLFPLIKFTFTLTFTRFMHNQRGLSPQEVCGRVTLPHCITAQSAVVQLPENAHLDSFTYIFMQLL